jgi:hypothetical protein
MGSAFRDCALRGQPRERQSHRYKLRRGIWRCDSDLGGTLPLPFKPELMNKGVF